MNPSEAETLFDCLRQIEAGTPPAVALAKYPDVRTELEPLVEAALAVRALPPQPVRAAFRARVQADLARLEAERAEAARGVVGGIGFPAALRMRRALARTHGVRPAHRLAVAAFALLLVLGGFVAAAAASRSGGLLAPLRHTWEHLLGGTPGESPDSNAPVLGPSPTEVGHGQVAKPSATRVARRIAPHLGRSVPAQPIQRPVAAAVDAPPPPVVQMAADITGEATPMNGVPAIQPAEDEPDRGEHGQTPVSAAPIGQPVIGQPVGPEEPPRQPSADPRVTATPAGGSPAPVPGTAIIAGSVKQGDATANRPLVGVVVSLYGEADFRCALTPPGTPYRTTRTDAEGSYVIDGLPAGRYLVSAAGGPECLPVRWHIGPSDPGTPDPCAALVIEMTDEGASMFTNILYESGLMTGCGTPAPTP